MRDPATFSSCTEFVQYLAEEFETLHRMPVDPIDHYYRLCIVQHDLQEVMAEEWETLTPEWQQYVRDFKETTDATCCQMEETLTPKQMARADFLYRAVLARREHEESSEQQSVVRMKRELRIDRAKLTSVIILFGILLLATLIVGRSLYLADTNYFEVVRSGDLSALRPRILLGKSVDSVDNYDRTALHHAAEMGHTRVVEFLLAEGADVSLLDLNNRSALHDAASSGSTEIVKRLIEAGAEVDQRSEQNLTPLMELMRQGHDYATTRETAQVLLDAGANVNASDGNNSVLTYAIVQAREIYANKALALSEFLVESGADVGFIGDNQTTALSNALLKYLPRRVDPNSVTDSDPLIAYLIEQGAMEAYRQSRESLEIPSDPSENMRLN
jgi:hypothetical protein